MYIFTEAAGSTLDLELPDAEMDKQSPMVESTTQLPKLDKSEEVLRLNYNNFKNFHNIDRKSLAEKFHEHGQLNGANFAEEAKITVNKMAMEESEGRSSPDTSSNSH